MPAHDLPIVRPVTVFETGPSGRGRPGRRLPIWIPLLFMGVVTVALPVMELHIGRLSTALWILTPVVTHGAYGVALLVYVLGMKSLARRGAPAGAVGLLLVVIGIAGPVTLRSLPELRIQTRFLLERPAFDEVAALSDSGRLPASQLGGYMGARLPDRLCFVSATCRVKTIGTSGGRPVLFVPDWLGIPDDAVGYARFAARPGGETFDGYGMRICPTVDLSDGWWWMGRCPPTR